MQVCTRERNLPWISYVLIKEHLRKFGADITFDCMRQLQNATQETWIKVKIRKQTGIKKYEAI